jgi:hypothetical protein
MPATLNLAPRVAGLLERVEVSEGGHRAETAGEVYESGSPQALVSQLASVLYQTLHTGRSAPLESTPRTWRDADFDAHLHQVLEGRTVTRSASVLRAEEERSVVQLDGVRVSVPAASLTVTTGGDAEVVLPAARPGLSPGFFFAPCGCTRTWTILTPPRRSGVRPSTSSTAPGRRGGRRSPPRRCSTPAPTLWSSTFRVPVGRRHRPAPNTCRPPGSSPQAPLPSLVR